MAYRKQPKVKLLMSGQVIDLFTDTKKSKPRPIDNTDILRRIKERELCINDELSKEWILNHQEI